MNGKHLGQTIYLNDLKIARRVIIDSVVEIDDHGFSDASEKAYGTSVYLRSTSTYFRKI